MRMRTPLMAAFRQAFDERDARQRIDERDEAGERVVAGRRATARSTMSEAALQRTVSEDLESLMNTTNLEACLDLEDMDAVRSSILNYGFTDIVHRTIDEIGVNEIGEEIQAALRAYEPRLAPGSVQVKRDRLTLDDDLKVRFVVRADLNCDPLNLPVEFVADLERDTGKISISRR
ncbi:type VI secretion system baseplate subunit TssE [Enterovirga sp. CN4-39]|uniref:type VI secretion system baseplate subunit TssE n=1 Tax=Enterovirga sp. CN4-39 TaxID=3400910 RepID=UPI003C08D971